MEHIQNLEKKIFYSIAGLLLILMPILSLNSGISGDEQTFHYPHGKNVYNYYATMGKDTTCLHYDNSVLHMYGPVFDVVTVVFIKLFKADDVYMVRHILNSMMGWMAILFAALIAVMLGGWRAGIITLIFMFLSPRFLGHSFNNPKDIPFSATYIFTIWGIIRYLKAFPEQSLRYAWPIALGIGLTIGVRVGGILLAFYFVFFAGLQYLLANQLKDWFQKANLQKLTRLLVYISGISIVGYIIGVILWPYAHRAPIAHTIEAMKYMEKYATSLKQIFEGKVIWSDHVPKYYLPKYIFMTIPEIVILGLVSFFILIKKAKKQYTLWYFILLFTSIFPVAYIIYKGSNIYGGWRHVMFIYPGLVVIAALGANMLIEQFKNKYIQWGTIAVFAILSLLPLTHIIRNHPNEYIYYNKISGGIDNAYGSYEMDYFYHSLRSGSQWLIDNKIGKDTIPNGKEIIVATNHSAITQYYFRHYKGKVKIIYIRYYERGNSDWDYAIMANSYISPFQLKKNIWPPANTIHTIDVDGKPICAILERKDRNDFLGYKEMSVGNFPTAISYFSLALKTDPKYEHVLYNQAECYLNLKDYNNAIQSAKACLKVYPGYDRALNIIGMSYMNVGQRDNALGVFLQCIKESPKYVAAYYYVGIIYAQNNNFDTALKYLNQALEVNAGYKPVYFLISKIYESQGKAQLAKQYLNYGNSIP